MQNTLITGIAQEDTATRNETVDHEDPIYGPTKSGKLDDLDNRGIYLKDLMNNEGANGPALLSHLVEEKADVTFDCIVCQLNTYDDSRTNAFENDNGESQIISNKMKANIVKDMKQLSITHLNVDASNKTDTANEAKMSSVKCHSSSTNGLKLYVEKQPVELLLYRVLG